MAKKRNQEWGGEERRSSPAVLIAGEQSSTNELLRRVLESRGYTTLCGQTVDGVLGLAADHLPRVVVLDLSAAGVGSSMHVLDAIRHHDDERVKNCRVVIVATSKSNRNFAFQSGADGFLVRPYHVDELVAMVENVLAVAHDERPLHRRRMIDAG